MIKLKNRLFCLTNSLCANIITRHRSLNITGSVVDPSILLQVRGIFGCDIKKIQKYTKRNNSAMSFSTYMHENPVFKANLVHNLTMMPPMSTVICKDYEQNNLVQNLNETLICANHGPAARWPKKANKGAKKLCRMMRQARKRLRTGL